MVPGIQRIESPLKRSKQSTQKEDLAPPGVKVGQEPKIADNLKEEERVEGGSVCIMWRYHCDLNKSLAQAC